MEPVRFEFANRKDKEGWKYEQVKAFINGTQIGETFNIFDVKGNFLVAPKKPPASTAMSSGASYLTKNEARNYALRCISISIDPEEMELIKGSKKSAPKGKK